MFLQVKKYICSSKKQVGVIDIQECDNDNSHQYRYKIKYSKDESCANTFCNKVYTIIKYWCFNQYKIE